MIRKLVFGVPAWSLGAPFAAWLMLVVTWGHPAGWIIVSLVAAALIVTCFAAVHHAEVVAHRVGEPFGALILALAITVIEVGLIVSIMLSGGTAVNALARDTVFATVMIVCNGVVGLCLLLGALRHNVLVFRVEGTSPALSVLIALTTLTLVLPSLTVTTPGPTLAPAQLVFAGVISLVLYGIFVFVQTVRHREYFVPIGIEDQGEHMTPPSTPVALTSFALMCVSLAAVVGLSKSLAPGIEAGVAAAAAPPAVVGIAIALLVLMPETSAAVRAAMGNRMQTSLNLALGSALATIGLTIPAVVVVSMLLGLPLALGLPPLERMLLLLTLLISTTTLASGRATVLQGAVHLVLFAVFLLYAFVP